jgi:hypothetical protein
MARLGALSALPPLFRHRVSLSRVVLTRSLSKADLPGSQQLLLRGTCRLMLLEPLLEEAHLVNPKSYIVWAEAVRIEERSDSGAPAQGKALLARAPQECPTSNILWSMAIWSEAGTECKARSVDALR